jgi:hypothetical protein
MRFHRLFTLLLGLAVAATVSAQSTETFDVSFGAFNADGSTTIALPEFDTNLGTLVGASLTLSSTLTGFAQVIDLTGATGSFTDATADFSQSGTFITLTGPGGLSETAHPVT